MITKLAEIDRRLKRSVIPQLRPFVAAVARILLFTVIYFVLMYAVSLLLLGGRGGIDWSILSTVILAILSGELVRGVAAYGLRKLKPLNSWAAAVTAGIFAGATFFFVGQNVFDFGISSKAWILSQYGFGTELPKSLAAYVVFGAALYFCLFLVGRLFANPHGERNVD